MMMHVAIFLFTIKSYLDAKSVEALCIGFSKILSVSMSRENERTFVSLSQIVTLSRPVCCKCTWFLFRIHAI